MLPAALVSASIAAGQPISPPGVPAKPAGQPPSATKTAPAGQGAVQPPAANSTGGANQAGQKDENVDAAAALFQQGKEEEAYKKLQEAVTKNPSLPPARLMLFRMYVNAGKMTQARQTIELAAVEAADHPDVYITLAGEAIGQQRLTDAVLLYEKALQVVSDTKRWNDSQRNNVKLVALSGLARTAEARASLAPTAEAKAQWEVARGYVEEMLKLTFTKAQLAPVRAQLGRIYFMLDDRDRALKEMEQAQADDANLEPPGVAMGRLFTGKANGERDKAKQRQLFDKAKEWFEYAVKKDPKSFKAHMAYAIWLFDMNYLDPRTYLALAEDELKEAARLDPKAMDVRVIRGLMSRWQGNFQAAEAEFDALAKEHPNDASITNQLVLSMLEQKDPAKLQRAMELSQENYRRTNGRTPEVTATLGWAFFKNNRLDEAEQALQQALRSGPSNSDAVYYYAQVLRFRGKLDDTVTALKAAINSSGRFMHRKEAQRDLVQLQPTGGGQ